MPKKIDAKLKAELVRGPHNPELHDALDRLRNAIFHAYAVFERQERQRDEPGGTPRLVHGKTVYPTEHERREDTLRFMRDEILEGRPLETFAGIHLELLELMVAYWRELEVDGEVEAKAPRPDWMQ